MWAKFDDRFWSHPKVVLAGNECVGAFVRIVCCCAERLSDGVIDEGTALMIAGRKKILDRLVEVRLMESREDGGFVVHDWHDWQPSAEETAARRSALSEKRSLAGKRGAESRWQNGKPDGKREATAKQPARQTDGPVPVPVPMFDDDDGAAVAADSPRAETPERPVDPRVERNAFEVLAEASRGAVSPLAHLDDMMAFNDVVVAVGIDHDELRAFGEWLTGRDAMKRLWPSSKPRAAGQTITAGWFTRSKSRVFLEGVQRWREITAGARITKAFEADDARHEAPVEAPRKRVIATDVTHMKDLFRRKA